MPRKAADETERSARSDGELDIDHRLRLTGELSASSVASFERAVRAVLQTSPRSIVVDLTNLASIDETGLTALLKAHLRSRQHGRPIEFVPAEHEAVKQVAAFTGSEDLSD